MEVININYPSGAKDDYLKELFVHTEKSFDLQFWDCIR